MGKKRCILIVDDNPDNIKVLVDLLSNQYELKVALNGKNALTISKTLPYPDLILLDIMMPEMDGFEVLNQLKKQSESKNLSVIFLTAKNSQKDILKAFEAGAVDYVTKPFNQAELIARVQTHMLIRQQRQTIETKNIEQQELLHVLCHDLGNHFSSIRMCRQLEIMKNNITKLADDIIYYVSDNGLELITLVKEMQSTTIKEFELKNENLLDAVNATKQLLNHRLLEKKISLKIDVNESIVVKAEKISLINTVLGNILSNAIKFSFRKSQINIKAIKEEEIVLLTIQDSGIGIPKKSMIHLFDISAKTNRSGTEGESGTGFGLSLVKKFVELYGGSLSLNSNADTSLGKQGTKVSIAFKNNFTNI